MSAIVPRNGYRWMTDSCQPVPDTVVIDLSSICHPFVTLASDESVVEAFSARCEPSTRKLQDGVSGEETMSGRFRMRVR